MQILVSVVSYFPCLSHHVCLFGYQRGAKRQRLTEIYHEFGSSLYLLPHLLLYSLVHLYVLAAEHLI